jgi:hypothetical protein
VVTKKQQKFIKELQMRLLTREEEEKKKKLRNKLKNKKKMMRRKDAKKEEAGILTKPDLGEKKRLALKEKIQNPRSNTET